MRYLITLFTLFCLACALPAQNPNNLPLINNPKDKDRLDTKTRGFSGAFRLDTLRAYFLRGGRTVDTAFTRNDTLFIEFTDSTSVFAPISSSGGGGGSAIFGGENVVVDTIGTDSIALSAPSIAIKEWSPDSTYQIDDFVTHNGIIWKALFAGSGQEPPLNLVQVSGVWRPVGTNFGEVILRGTSAPGQGAPTSGLTTQDGKILYVYEGNDTNVGQKGDIFFQPFGGFWFKNSNLSWSKTDELQTLSLSSNNLTISSGNSVALPTFDDQPINDSINDLRADLEAIELTPGPAGPAGDAATIAVGTTTTGSPGTNASVTNSGTSSAAVFDFTIPQGLTGAQGATGAQGPAGLDGQGWTSGTYNASTGQVTFASDDGLGFTTGDLRGADGTNGSNGADGQDGVGIASTSYNASTGVLTLTFTDASSFSTTDIRGTDGLDGDDGVGISLTTYDPATGTVTFNYSNGSSFTTGDLRGDDGATGPQGPAGDPATDDQDITYNTSTGEIELTGSATAAAPFRTTSITPLNYDYNSADLRTPGFNTKILRPSNVNGPPDNGFYFLYNFVEANDVTTQLFIPTNGNTGRLFTRQYTTSGGYGAYTPVGVSYTSGGEAGRIPSVTADGRLRQTGIDYATGGVYSFLNGSGAKLTAPKSLEIGQTGDVFGGTSLLLRNRSGHNGMRIITDDPTITLADLQFKTSLSPFLTFRAEARAANTQLGDVQQEFQMFYNDAGSITNYLSVGPTRAKFHGNAGLRIPVGNTAQRWADQGAIRYNTTLSQFEGYNGSAWTNMSGAGDNLGNHTATQSIQIGNNPIIGTDLYIGPNEVRAGPFAGPRMVMTGDYLSFDTLGVDPALGVPFDSYLLYAKEAVDEGLQRSRLYLQVQKDAVTQNSVREAYQLLTDQDVPAQYVRRKDADQVKTSGSTDGDFTISSIPAGSYRVTLSFRIKTNTAGGGIFWFFSSTSGVVAADSGFSKPGSAAETSWLSGTTENSPASVNNWSRIEYTGVLEVSATGSIAISTGPNGIGNVTIGKNSYIRLESIENTNE